MVAGVKKLIFLMSLSVHVDNRKKDFLVKALHKDYMTVTAAENTTLVLPNQEKDLC